MYIIFPRYDAAAKKLVMHNSYKEVPVSGTYDVALNMAKLTNNPQATNELKSTGTVKGSLRNILPYDDCEYSNPFNLFLRN
jgi:hypothetical protein